jgi:hypothetical protein
LRQKPNISEFKKKKNESGGLYTRNRKGNNVSWRRELIVKSKKREISSNGTQSL